MIKISSLPALAFVIAAASTALAPMPAPANPYAQNVELRILRGWRSDGNEHIAALQLILAEGWKTYWRAPGDAGLPPVLHWQKSQNIDTISITWPTPEVIDQNGMTSIGYHGDVVLPLRIKVQEGGKAQINGTLQIGVCKDICVPVTLKLRANLPAVGNSDPRIHAAIADQPLSAKRAGAGKVRCAVQVIDGGLRLTAHMPLPSTGAPEHAIIESRDPQIWVSEAQTKRNGTTLTATADLIHMTGAAFALDRAGLRFTVLGRERAVDIQGCAGN